MPKIVNGVIQSGNSEHNDDNESFLNGKFGVCFGREISWTNVGIFMFICGIFGGMPGLFMGALALVACRLGSQSSSSGNTSSIANTNASKAGANIKSINDYPKPVKC